MTIVGVSLEDGVELKANAIIDGNTRIGSESIVYPFACVGGEPQVSV